MNLMPGQKTSRLQHLFTILQPSVNDVLLNDKHGSDVHNHHHDVNGIANLNPSALNCSSGSLDRLATLLSQK